MVHFFISFLELQHEQLLRFARRLNLARVISCVTIASKLETYFEAVNQKLIYVNYHGNNCFLSIFDCFCRANIAKNEISSNLQNLHKKPFGNNSLVNQNRVA